MNPAILVFSKATYVNASSIATAAATYSFVTKGYKPGRQERMIDSDVVRNQNGLFKYVYDNGPGYRQWSPFQISCEKAFSAILGANEAQQYANLISLWNHPGILGMKAPDGVFQVVWAGQPLEPEFIVFPRATGATAALKVTIQLEEAS